MSCSSASVGFCPRDRITVPNSLVVIVPSPSLSNKEKASLNSAICSSVNWSACLEEKKIALVGRQCDRKHQTGFNFETEWCVQTGVNYDQLCFYKGNQQSIFFLSLYAKDHVISTQIFCNLPHIKLKVFVFALKANLCLFTRKKF